MVNAVVGSDKGVYLLQDGTLESLGLDEQRISAVHTWQDPSGKTTVLAGSYGNGLFRSEDGKQWTQIDQGLTASAFRTIGPDPLNGGAILCGTEPARIFRSADGGLSWRELEGILSL